MRSTTLDITAIIWDKQPRSEAENQSCHRSSVQDHKSCVWSLEVFLLPFTEMSRHVPLHATSLITFNILGFYNCQNTNVNVRCRPRICNDYFSIFTWINMRDKHKSYFLFWRHKMHKGSCKTKSLNSKTLTSVYQFLILQWFSSEVFRNFVLVYFTCKNDVSVTRWRASVTNKEEGKK